MRIVGIALAGALLLSGCGSSGAGTATVTPKMRKTGGTRRLSTADFATPFERWVAPALGKKARIAGQVGQTRFLSLTSLQYYVQSIELCASLTIDGTGYSGKSGCTEVYANAGALDTSVYNTYTITEAAADTDPTHFIDFLDATSVAALEKPVAIEAGTYNYALINFMRPIKMQASFLQPDGTTVLAVTKAGTAVAGPTDSDGRELEYLRPTGTDTGSPELMTYMLNNGGVWFPMLSPFVVAAGDEIEMDFVFNPNNFATATFDPACTAATNEAVKDEGACITFDLPYAKMAPVPRKSGESTRKETYLVDYTGSPMDAKLRVELYYNDADTTKAIRGIDIAVVSQVGATQASTNVVSALKATETSGNVTFVSYNPTTSQVDADVLTNLTRRTDGTVHLTCVFTGGPCNAAGETYDLAYTYEGDAAL